MNWAKIYKLVFQNTKRTIFTTLGEFEKKFCQAFKIGINIDINIFRKQVH